MREGLVDPQNSASPPGRASSEGEATSSPRPPDIVGETPRFSPDGMPTPAGLKQPDDPNAADEPITDADKEAKNQLALVLGLKLQGKTTAEIQKLTGLKIGQVRWAYRYLRNRKLMFSGVEEALFKFQNEAVPAAIEGFQRLIDKRDKQAIFKALDGAGITASKDKGAHTPALPTLTVNVIMPPGMPAPHLQPAVGTVVGTPLSLPATTEPGDGA